MDKNSCYPPHVKIGDTEAFLTVLQKFSRKIKNILDISQSGSTVSVCDDLISPTFLDIPMLVSNIEIASTEELLIRNIFVANLQELERQSSIGAHIYCMMIKKMCDEIRMHVAAKSNYHDDISLDLRKYSRRCRLTEIDSILEKIVEDDIVLEIFECASTLIGGEGQISVDVEDSKFETVVEMYDMFTFTFGMDNNFSKNARLSHIELRDSRVVIIDGIFENTSEIERFLFHASENSESIIIVARGFSEDISSILAMNYQIKGIQVFPIVIPFDLYGANAMKDLAVVTGNDIVSSLKGDLISSIRINEHAIVKNTRLYKDKLLVKEQKNFKAVKRSLQELEKKRLDINSDDIRKILEKRIRSLSACHVSVKLGKDIIANYKMVAQKLQYAITVFNEICKYGIIDTVEIMHEPTLSQPERSILSKFKKNGRNIVPSHSLKSAIRAIRATKYLLMHTGMYVISTE